jgi:hypothetical protein
MATHSIRTIYTADGVQQFDYTNNVTGIDGAFIDATIPASQTDSPIHVSFLHTGIAAYFLQADQNCTVYVNDIHSGAPSATITLTANVPHFIPNGSSEWGSADVTVLYVTTGVNATHITGRVLRTT